MKQFTKLILAFCLAFFLTSLPVWAKTAPNKEGSSVPSISPKATKPSIKLLKVKTKTKIESISAPKSSQTVNNTALSQKLPEPTQIHDCGDNSYARYIYMHESGCSTSITNAIGCLGIGQACPGSKLRQVCPNLDYACENRFFTSYATSVYGGWAGAYQWWLRHSWW